MHYALPSAEMYPIETEEQVKLANDYFGKYMTKFHPVERATIATNIEKRASALNMDLESGWVKNYSRRDSYSPDFDLHMKMRKEACVGKKVTIEGKELEVDALMSKVAASKDHVRPQDMMTALADFDKKAGLEHLYDQRFRDPVFTVFGSASNPYFDQVKLAGGLTESGIKKLAGREGFISKIASVFGDNFANDFKAAPVDIFNSMPKPEQQSMIEMAKTAESECDTPGEKKKSKGKGRGLAKGKGKGPIGVPYKEKEEDD